MTHSELRELFLFADLTDTQLEWICEHGETVDVRAGDMLVTEGDQARCFYVLLSGALQMTRLVAGDLQSHPGDTRFQVRLPL